QAAVDPSSKRVETLRVALEKDGCRRAARPPEHGLRALDDSQQVVALRCDVGARRVHPAGAGAEHLAAVRQHVQARTEHAAEHRIAVRAATAYRGEAWNGQQVITGVA